MNSYIGFMRGRRGRRGRLFIAVSKESLVYLLLLRICIIVFLNMGTVNKISFFTGKSSCRILLVWIIGIFTGFTYISLKLAAF